MEIKLIQYIACTEMRSWEVLMSYYFSLQLSSVQETILCFSQFLSLIVKSHIFQSFRKLYLHIQGFYMSKKSKRIPNCNIFICLGTEKVSWEIQLRTPFHSSDVNLCATLHAFSHSFGIHSEIVLCLFASRIFKID